MLKFSMLKSQMLKVSALSIAVLFTTRFANAAPADVDAKSKAAAIANFTPQSLSESVNQIRATFSDKMVALDVNPNADVFNISCSPKLEGSASWTDERTWTFDFSTKLHANKIPGGSRCTVELKPGIKTLAGAVVKGKTKFQFQIDGPNIISIYPGDTNGTSKDTVTEDQIFAIGLDADVDAATVLKNAYFKVEGVASPYQIRILSDAEKATLQKAENYPQYEFSADLPILMIQSKQAFPANKKVSLVWGQGIKSSASGLTRQKTLILPYESRPLLTASFSCQRENAKADCSPFSDMEVNFSADIPEAMAKQIVLVGADGTVVHGTFDPASGVSKVTFPASVREKQSYKLQLPTGIKDDNGRPLANAASYPLTVKTSDFPPLAKFASDFGVIEANVKPVLLPATLRNLEAQVIGKTLVPTSIQGSALKLSANNFPAVVSWMKKLDIKESKSASFKDRDHSIFSDSKSAKATSPFNVPLKAGGKAFEVVGIPLGGPGFYVVELQSRLLGRDLLGKDATMYVPTGALVTNMVVHAKWGQANSLFWVTALDTGAPVPNAQVSVYDCAGKAVGQSLTTDANGVAKLDGDLKKKVNLQACQKGDVPVVKSSRRKHHGAATGDEEDASSKYDTGFFVSASLNDDFTFTHSGWNEGIEYWRFGSNINDQSPEYASDNTIAHTVLDRSLLRAGDTISMKHFIRTPSLKGLTLMAAASLPTEAWIQNDDSGTKYTAKLSWDKAGVATSTFVIPKDAKLGTYSVTLVKANGQDVAGSYSSATFQVMEFKIPQLKGTIAFPAKVDQLVQPGKLPALVSVNYQDGGPAINKAVSFRYTVSKGFGQYFESFPDMNFGQDKVVEVHGRTQDSTEQNEKTVQIPLRLDNKGAGTVTIPDLSGLTASKVVSAQLEFTDSNQESQNVTRTVTVYPSARLAAIQAQDSYSSGKTMKFKVAVADIKGKAVASALPNFQVFEQVIFTHKTKMVGGFYSSESFTDVNPTSIGVKCDGSTDAKGFVSCEAKVPQSGTYIVQAEIRDPAGNSSFASETIYVRGTRRAWFPADNNDRMDLVANQPQAQSGQNATFQVKMPFASATVLVTIEREGILDSFVTNVTTQNPVITVPIKAAYAPNVFVSALAVRGRVSGAGNDETSTVDLGKPAYKLGLAPLNVNWKDHTLKVTVKPSKDSLKPRETSSVDVTITDPSGKPVPNAEFALAIVDKGLLDLAKNKSWDLLKDMMSKRPLTVATSTAQMQVIGKRHYGLKAKPTGGDGGSAPTRELFDTLVKWVDRVKTDANGKANVPFTMNDSLTAFQIVAVANAGVDKFGKGEATIVSQQDIVLIPAVSQLTRNGDTSNVDFTIRNATKQTRTVSLQGRVKLTFADGHVEYRPLSTQTVTLNAMDSSVVNLGNSNVPDGVTGVSFEITAQDQNKSTIDSINIKQTVSPSVMVRTWMAQLSRIDAKLAPVDVKVPNSVANQGGVAVNLMPSLTGNLGTVSDTLKDYPFVSLESLVSRAVVSGDKAIWKSAMAKLPSYLDQDGLVMYYPSASSATGSDTLTAYILSMANYSGLQIPQDAREKMVQGLTDFVEGKSRAARGKNQTAADTYIRRVAAIEVLARDGVAQSTWLTSLPSVVSTQLPTSTIINLIAIYSELSNAPARAAKLADAQSVLRARLTRVGTGLKLTDDVNACGYCMTSADSDQLQLILVIAKNQNLDGAWHNDVPLLVNAAVGMMNRGAWNLTVADAYGVLAMKAYSAKYEPQVVTGTTTVALGSAPAQTLEWTTSPKGGLLNFGFPAPGDYSVKLNHAGTGSPWAVVAVKAAVPLTSKVERHISVTKTLDPVKSVYTKGDVVTVTLTIKTQTSLSQVSLIDPIPAGAKIEGTGLDNDASNGAQTSGYVYPDAQELANDGYHASYGYVPADPFTVVYKIRLNNAGTFKLPTTRVEAVYAPENFAEVPNADITVQP